MFEKYAEKLLIEQGHTNISKQDAIKKCVRGVRNTH